MGVKVAKSTPPILEHRIVSDNLISWVESWLSAKQLAGKKPRTIQFYAEKLRPLIVFLNDRGIDSMEAVSVETLREYFSYQKTRHNEGGLHSIYRAIRAFFRWYGEEVELEVQKNPIRKIKIKAAEPDKLDPYTVEEINKLLLASKDTLIANAMIKFLYDTGIRITEMISLRLTDYDHISGDIKLKETITKNSEDRPAHLGQDTRRTMRRYLNTRSDNCPYLFATEDGTKYTYSGARGLMETVFAHAGVDYHGFHGFRRAWFNNMAMAGLNVYGMQILGGWKDVKTPARYFKLLEKQAAQLSAKHSPVDDL